MSYEAVLFDLDGTLLDTIEDLGDSVNAALAEMGFSGHGYEAYKMFIGSGMETLIRRALPEGHRDEGTVRGTLDRMRRVYAGRMTARTRPYAGVPELLDGLTELGVGKAILSNKPDRFTRRLVEELLGGWDFDVVRGALDGIPTKPDPTGALRVVDEMGVRLGATVYVGDSGTDMGMALAAGMGAFGATWGFRPRSELVEGGAMELLERPQDLLRFFP
ncbi:MAG: HAD family hydrolase [Planctomycetes bacterium]|nr:HAD family hydrolase [Planctomycetota bacterium]